MKKQIVVPLLALGLISSLGIAQQGTPEQLERRLPQDVPLLSKPLPASPQMGLSVDTLSDQLREHFAVSSGVFVRLVVAGSAAEKAGILEGDVLLSVNEEPVVDANDLYAMIQSHQVGDQLKLDILRSGKPMQVTVTLEVPPKEIAEQPGTGLGLGDFLQEQLEQLGSKLGDQVDLNQLDQIEKLLGRQIFDIRRAGSTTPELKTLRIEIDRKENGPASVRVTRDGKTIETTSDALDLLPADMRPMLEQLLGVAGRLTVDFGGMVIEVPFPVSPTPGQTTVPAASDKQQAPSMPANPEKEANSELLVPPSINLAPSARQPQARKLQEREPQASEPQANALQTHERPKHGTRPHKSLEEMRREVERMQDELERLQRELRQAK